MKKVVRLLKAIGLIIRKPYLLNLVIDDNENWRKKLKKKYGIPGGLDEVSFHDLTDGDEVIVKPFAFMEGGSLPTDLALLKVLAGKFDRCSYFEIGTWRGESVANVADVAAECSTLNLPASSMAGMGLPKEYIDQHAMFSRGLSNVKHLEGDSAEFDYAGLNKKFDLIFIDGDHHYESIKRDTQNVFEHLIHEKSIVVWHDYAWQPGEVRYETLAAILDGIPSDFRNNLFSVRNTLCALFFPHEIDHSKPSNIAIRGEAFEIILSKSKK